MSKLPHPISERSNRTGRVRFLRLLDTIKSELEQRDSLVEIYNRHREELGFSMSQYRYYVRRYVTPKGVKPTPKAVRRLQPYIAEIRRMLADGYPCSAIYRTLGLGVSQRQFLRGVKELRSNGVEVVKQELVKQNVTQQVLKEEPREVSTESSHEAEPAWRRLMTRDTFKKDGRSIEELIGTSK